MFSSLSFLFSVLCCQSLSPPMTPAHGAPSFLTFPHFLVEPSLLPSSPSGWPRPRTLFQGLVPILARGRGTPSNLLRVGCPTISAAGRSQLAPSSHAQSQKGGSCSRGHRTTGRHVMRQVSLRGMAECEFDFPTIEPAPS